MGIARTNILLIAIAAILCSAIILVGIYPYHPKSPIGWIILYLISFPVVIVFEELGNKVFSDNVSRKLSRGVRIIYGVIVLGLIFILSTSVVSWLEPYLGKWGS
jgi:uncharacterized membrane protein (DUF485 family)